MPAEAKLYTARETLLRRALSRIEQLACGGLEEGLSTNESIIVRAIMHRAQEALDAFARVPEPVERQRCVTHDAEYWNHVEEVGDLCYEAGWDRSDDYDPEPCRFVTVYEVPAPSQPGPPDEATT